MVCPLYAKPTNEQILIFKDLIYPIFDLIHKSNMKRALVLRGNVMKQFGLPKKMIHYCFRDELNFKHSP
jgi:hypothetical protein